MPPAPNAPLLSKERPLLLASGSPRRREILETLGVPLVVAPAGADESTREGEAPAAYLERVVQAKLEAARAHLRDAREPVANAATILVADTVVVRGSEILGKPPTVAAAEAMIRALAGRSHEVWTRFAIGTPDRRAPHAETVRTRVTFRALSAAQIAAYAATGEGLDKAGGYGVQGRASAFVSRIEGSYTNVVGLPACEVAAALEALDLLPR